VKVQTLWGEDYYESKQCAKCGEEKLLSEYCIAGGGNYHRSECRQCNNHLTKIRKQLKKDNPLPKEDYVCPICLRDEEQVKGRGGRNLGAWCLDHNHKDNTFRGYLCHDCNRALGNFREDIKTLERAIKYLNG